MTRRKLLDLGDTAFGRAVDIDDWGGTFPAFVKPRTVVYGKVVGLQANAPEIVEVEDARGRRYWIKLRAS